MPRPQQHAELRIAADGSYTFNAAAVPREQLPSAVLAAKHPAADLVVQIEPVPAASVDSIRAAVEAVKSAHARVAFQHEVR